VILVFAGRRPGSDAFPAENISAVDEQARRLVAALGPRLAIGSGAAGADLIVADAALETGAGVEVLLAGSRERFRAESVDDKGAPWPDRFDRLLSNRAVTVTEVPRLDDADASYRAVTAAIAERAKQFAEAGEAVTLLALGSPREGRVDHTEELVALAKAGGWRILRIDTARPLPAA
jgi:hypothetical protein